MAEMETVMQRLDAQTKTLRERAQSAAGNGAEPDLTLQSLAIVSEALLRLSRDIRQMRLQMAADRS